MIKTHILPDVLKPGLKIVFSGTAAGAVSAQRQAYYAGPGNKFWKIIYQIGLTDELLGYEEYRRVLEFKIGLTDVVKTQSGADKDIDFRKEGREAFVRKIQRYAPTILAFNGKKSAQTILGRTVQYGAQTERFGKTRIFILPSTSGAANGFWDDKYWYQLVQWV